MHLYLYTYKMYINLQSLRMYAYMCVFVYAYVCIYMYAIFP